MFVRVAALILSPYQRMAVAAAFDRNGLLAVDPLKAGRSPRIIVARNRIEVACTDEADFIPVRQHHRKRARQPMIANPNRERGFRLAEKP